MRGRGIRFWLSWTLILGGAVLLILGARDFLGPLAGQKEAAREWQRAEPPAPYLGTAFARLSVPRLGASWFVFEGIGERELRLGPGHMPGTALPGSAGNCVIAGHRDTHFRALKDIREGDELLIETRTGQHRYRVRSLSVVKPTNTSALRPTAQGVLNLITCYPFYYVGSAPKRFVVEAELEPPAGAQQPARAARATQTGRPPS